MLGHPCAYLKKERGWDGDNIVLEPMVEIPARELWLYENIEALAKVKTGLSQRGTIERGSFSRYAEE